MGQRNVVVFMAKNNYKWYLIGWASLHDVVRPKFRASAVGIMNSLGCAATRIRSAPSTALLLYGCPRGHH